jgi:hypothetical protein
MASTIDDGDLASWHALIEFQMLGRHDCVEGAGDGEERRHQFQRGKLSLSSKSLRFESVLGTALKGAIAHLLW